MVYYNLKVLIKLILFIFIPVVLVVIGMLLLLPVYYSKVRDNEKKLEFRIRRGNLLSLVLCTVVALLLFVIDLIFAIKFTGTLSKNNLVDSNIIIYNIVYYSPAIPLVFFVYYFVSMFIYWGKKYKVKVEDYDEIGSSDEKVISEYGNDDDSNIDTAVDVDANVDTDGDTDNDTEDEIEVL